MNYDDFLNDYLRGNRKKMIADLMELIRIPSIRGEAVHGAPYGAEVRCALDRAAEQARRLGLRVYIPEHKKYGYCDIGQGEKIVGIMPHLDVVPALGNWSKAPFEPYITDGYIVGRGSSDDKGGCIASLYALDALQKSGASLNSRVRLIFGCNEETGMDDVAALVSDGQKPDFTLVPDAFWAIGIGHKGRISLTLECNESFHEIIQFSGGDESGASVPDKAHCTLPYCEEKWFELQKLAPEYGTEICREGSYICLTARGVSAHPAMPDTGVNAINRLAALLVAADILPSGDTAILRTAALVADGFSGAAFDIAGSDALSGSLTCVCVKARTEHDHLVLSFNIRFCVTMDPNDLEAKLRLHAKDLGFRLVDILISPAHLYSPDDPMIPVLRSAYHQVTKQAADLYIHPGGTYAALLGSSVIFGNEFRKPSPFGEGRERAHQCDEFTSIEDLLLSIRIYFYALLAASEHLGGSNHA